MKRYIISLLTAFFAATGMYAMSYEEAREQARYLTDKMAYELNLNEEQYNDAYEINLDYLMSLRSADDVYGIALTHRNADIRSILYDWQYTLFAAASYFFHPVYWRANAWHYPIYTYYRPGFFYYNTPRVYVTYRGGHGRHYYTRISYYNNRRPVWNGGFRGEHRGAVEHRGPGYVGRPEKPVPPRRPDRPAADRPGTSQRPGRGENGGFRFETGRPDAGNGNSHAKPGLSRPDRGESIRPVRPETRNGNSYQRQSSTRTTVRQSSPQVRRSSTGSRQAAPARPNRVRR